MNDKIMYLIFYAFIILVSGVLAYLKVIDPLLVAALIGGVFGHGSIALPNVSIPAPPTSLPAG